MLGVLEIPRSGAGLKLLESLINCGRPFVLITDDLSKYTKTYGPNSLFSRLSSDQLLVVDNSLDADSVEKAVRQSGIIFSGFLSNLDRFVLVLAEVAKRLGIRFHKPASILSAYDKAKSRIRAEKHGIRIPDYLIYKDQAEALRFLGKHHSCVVKLSRGTGSEFVKIVHSKEQLLDVLKEYGQRVSEEPSDIVLESFANGPLYSAETISFEGKHQVLGFTDRTLGAFPHFAELGGSFPAILPQKLTETLKTFAVSVLDAFDISNGICHTEFILSAEGPVFVELNPRIAGAQIGKMVAMTYDVDMYKIMIDLHLGIAPPTFTETKFSAAYRDLYVPVEGVLRSISGEESVRRSPGVVELLIKEGLEGKSLGFARNWTGSVGHAIATGANSQIARNNLDSALRMLTFDIEA